MARALSVLSILWPLTLWASVWLHVDERAPALTTIVYAAGSRVCHQRDERSFHTLGVKWPVCARCSALYAAAPIGAFIALGRRRRIGRRELAWLAVASVPTAVTLLLEWFHLTAMTNLVRAVAGVPLGAMVAFVVVCAAAGRADGIE